MGVNRFTSIDKATSSEKLRLSNEKSDVWLPYLPFREGRLGQFNQENAHFQNKDRDEGLFSKQRFNFAKVQL